MIKTVTNFIDKYGLSDKKIIVGFSGGFDSICLLDILIKIKNEKKLNIVAAHLNHNWRGEKSKREQDYCKQFCEKMGVEFYTETLSDDVKKTETAARELRYEFFEKTLKKYTADAIFTAHNFDDNAETVLYRIFKGTGIIGLQGIAENRGYYYRPLLNCQRKDIEKYCIENNLNPNNDNSNYDTKYKRNLIRCEIIPLIKKINPEIKKTINNLSLVAQSESYIIDEYINELMSDISDNGVLSTKKYISLSDDVKKRIIYNLIYESEIDYDYSKIMYIYDFIEKTAELGHPSRMSLSDDKWLYVDSSIIEFISSYDKIQDVLKIEDDGNYSLDGNRFEIIRCSKKEITYDETEAYVDLKNYKNLVLRTRREGDIITPLGSSGSVKLKKYLIDKKIPQHKRDKLVLLCSDKNVLWVAGVGLNDKIKVTSNPTHKLSIKYEDRNIL